MKSNVYAIIVAGGQGLRMGAGIPKQFLTIGGKTLLQLTVEKFIEACPGIRIIVVLPGDHMQLWKDICLESNLNYPQILVKGGITRFHSVLNALAKVPDGALVAVHDGVRPLVSTEFISSMLGKMDRYRALVPVLPVTDTLKSLVRGDDGTLSCSGGPDPDRSRVFGAQTPQIFRSEDIKAAYGQAFDLSFTDDDSVVRRKGIPVTYVEGEKFNIKITTKEDLELARAIISIQDR